MVLLRPLQPQDRALLCAGIAALSDHSRYLRFFNGARVMPDAVIDRLVDVDGNRHIAWGALDLAQPGQPAIGVVRAVRTGDLPEAELALAVVDHFHGKGLARLLLTAVVADCLQAGISELTAETLAENAGAKRLFRAIGGVAVRHDGPVVSYRFDAALAQARLADIGAGSAMTNLRCRLQQMSGPVPMAWAG